MNNIKTIARYAFWESFFPFFKNKKIANLPKNHFLRIVTLLIGYIFMAYFSYLIMFVVGKIFLPNPDGDSMYFTYFGIMVSLTILVFHLPQIISNIFSDKKISIYKTLPLKPGELFIGKVLGDVLSFVDYLLFLLITFIIYFINRGFSIKILVFALVNFFNLIFTTYGLLTFLILILMRFTNVGEHRKLVKTIGYVILFAILGVFYAYPMLNDNGSSARETGQAISMAIEQIEGISNVFFTSKLFGKAVGGDLFNNIIYTLVFLASSALIGYGLYKFADKNYYDSLGKESSKNHKNKGEENLSRVNLKAGSQVSAIFKRDIKTLFSNVVFLAATIPMFIIFGTLGAKTGSEIRKDASGLFFADPEIRFWIFLIGFLLAVMIWANSGFANTALSREHKSFYLFQSLPIDYKKHFKARLIAANLISFAFNLILTILFTLTVKFGTTNGLILFLGMGLGSILANSFALYTGSKNIKINWTKPEEINKGNFKGLLYYFLSLIFIGLLAIINVLLSKLFANAPYIGWIIVSIILVVVTLLSIKLALSSYKKGFYDIND